jgi:DsbC/DsbD-like thiol-disulfide interchange protein
MTRSVHQHILRSPLLTLLVILLGASGCREGSEAPETSGSGHATARLIADTNVLSPGNTYTLGVTFEIEPEWHLYSNLQNDTGYPISVTLELPEGFEAGVPEWPAPERHVSPGNILDHVYKEEVTLLIPLRVPEDVKTGEWATIRGHMEWLACREVCVPGQGDATITLLIAETGTDLWQAADREPSPDAARRFAEAHDRTPVSLAEDELTWEWAEGALVIAAEGADFLGFYPDANSVTPEFLVEDGESGTGRLSLRLPEDPGDVGFLSGVVEIRQEGIPHFFILTVPLRGSG